MAVIIGATGQGVGAAIAIEIVVAWSTPKVVSPPSTGKPIVSLPAHYQRRLRTTRLCDGRDRAPGTQVVGVTASEQPNRVPEYVHHDVVDVGDGLSMAAIVDVAGFQIHHARLPQLDPVAEWIRAGG